MPIKKWLEKAVFVAALVVGLFLFVPWPDFSVLEADGSGSLNHCAVGRIRKLKMLVTKFLKVPTVQEEDPEVVILNKKKHWTHGHQAALVHAGLGSVACTFVFAVCLQAYVKTPEGRKPERFLFSFVTYGMISNIMVLIGIKRKNPWMIIPWFLFHVAGMIFHILLFVLLALLAMDYSNPMNKLNYYVIVAFMICLVVWAYEIWMAKVMADSFKLIRGRKGVKRTESPDQIRPIIKIPQQDI